MKFRPILSKLNQDLKIWLRSTNFSHKALNAFFASGPAAIAILDPDLRCVKANSKVAEMLGCPLEEIIGQPTRDVLPLLADKFDPILRRVSLTGKPELNYSVTGETRKSPGLARQWVASAFPIYPDGNGHWYVGCMAVEVVDETYFEQLRKSEALLSEAEEIGQLGSWEQNLATGEDLWSTNLCRMLNVDPANTKTTDSLFWELLHPDDYEAVRTTIEGGMKFGIEYEYQSRLILPGGRERTFYTHGKPILGTDNQVIKRIGVTQDISARVEVERALQESEKSLSLFRELIDRSNDAIEIVDPTTLRFLDVNQKMCSDLGYTRDELLQMTVYDIDPTLDHETEASIGVALKHSGSFIKESIHRRKDGSTFPVEINLSLIQLDRPYVTTVVRDITERKRAQDLLQESETRMRIATRAGRMFAYEWDAVTDIVVLSEECKNIFGANAPLRTTRRELIDAIHPEDRHVCDLSIITPESPNSIVRFRHTRTDGVMIWVEKTARAFFDEDGKMVRIIGMVADITERKEADDALYALSAKLINLRDEERRRIAIDLHESLAQDLAALKLSLGHAERLLSKDGNGALGALNEGVRLTDALIKQVRSLSYTLHPHLLDEVGLPLAIESYARRFSERTGIQVSVRIDEQEGIGRFGREFELTVFRIVQECFSNIHRHSKSPIATVSVSRDSDRLKLEIADQGQGMPRTSEKGTHTAQGIGIASIRERVKQLHGMFLIESNVGHGVTVRVVLPIPLSPSRRTFGAKVRFDQNVSNSVGR